MRRARDRRRAWAHARDSSSSHDSEVYAGAREGLVVESRLRDVRGRTRGTRRRVTTQRCVRGRTRGTRRRVTTQRCTRAHAYRRPHNVCHTSHTHVILWRGIRTDKHTMCTHGTMWRGIRTDTRPRAQRARIGRTRARDASTTGLGARGSDREVRPIDAFDRSRAMNLARGRWMRRRGKESVVEGDGSSSGGVDDGAASGLERWRARACVDGD